MNYAEVLKKKYSILLFVGNVSHELGIRSWAIGGFVRDLILKKKIYDIDIVCLNDCLPLVNKCAEYLNIHNVVIYKRYGTAMFIYNGVQLEFVTARKESYNHDSRNPVVEAASFHEDQIRRDFTINTLAISLNRDDFGELIDEMGGFGDLQNKIVRTTVDPAKTFDDDPLRMLRAIRFATQLNFQIDNDTLNGIKLYSNRIKIIPQERITTEINKILSAPVPSIGFKLLMETGLLQILMPFIYDLCGRSRVGNMSHKDIYYHTLQVVDSVAAWSDNLWLRWTALLHDVAKPKTKRFDNNHGFTFYGHEEIGARMAKEIFTKMKLPTKQLAYVTKLIRLHLRPIAIAKDEVTDSGVRRLATDAGDVINDLLLLCRADVTSHNEATVMKYLHNFDLVEQKLKDVAEKDYINNLQPVLSGDIIMKELNVPPSPIIGAIKTRLKNAILSGEIENTYEANYVLFQQICNELGQSLKSK